MFKPNRNIFQQLPPGGSPEAPKDAPAAPEAAPAVSPRDKVLKEGERRTEALKVEPNKLVGKKIEGADGVPSGEIKSIEMVQTFGNEKLYQVAVARISDGKVDYLWVNEEGNVRAPEVDGKPIRNVTKISGQDQYCVAEMYNVGEFVLLDYKNMKIAVNLNLGKEMPQLEDLQNLCKLAQKSPEKLQMTVALEMAIDEKSMQPDTKVFYCGVELLGFDNLGATPSGTASNLKVKFAGGLEGEAVFAD